MTKGMRGVPALSKKNNVQLHLEETLVYGNLGVNISKSVDYFVKNHLGYSILTRILLKSLELSNEFFRIEILLKKENNKICILFFGEKDKQIGVASFHKPDFMFKGLKLLFVSKTMYLLEEIPATQPQ